MGKRRRARELAVKVLYRLDLTGEEWADVRAALAEYDGAETVRAFGGDLVEAVLAQREKIDEILGAAASNWRVERMALVDRNILRVALAEHLVFGETPEAVIIDEAIEIAATFSTEESGRFVNGILDHVLGLHPAGELSRGREGGAAR